MTDDDTTRFLRSCDELDRLLDRAHADLTAARLTVEKLALSVDAGVTELRAHIDASFAKIGRARRLKPSVTPK